VAHLAFVGQGPEIAIDLVFAERRNRERRHELVRRLGHDNADRAALLAQPADQLEALIGRDAARDDQQNPPVLQQLTPPSPLSPICYCRAPGTI